MHLTIRQYRVEPSAVDEIMRRVEEGFVPLISQAAGFVAFYAVDFGGGQIASISVFADEAGARASTQLSAEHVRRQLAELFSSAPEVQTGAVRVQRISGAGT